MIELRKLVTTVEEIRHEFGPPPPRPIKIAAVAAVLRNPFAGGYQAEIQHWMEPLKALGDEMAARLVQALGGDPAAVEAYGKGGIVGGDGELEHAALWHVPGGYAMRRILGEAKAIVPSATKVGGVGARLDVPLGHVNAAYVRSHFSAVEIGVPDAPRAHEIVLILAMADGGRIHARVGGLQASEISVWDGQR